MAYKHFYKEIFTRLVFIILFAGATAFFCFGKQDYYLTALFVLLLIVATINIIRYFNHLNRWISFFLLGIENDDTTLKVPSTSGNKAIDEVYKGMERLNKLFRQTKTEISTKEYYYRSVINQSSTGLFSVNEKGRVININPEAVKLVNLKEYYHINTLGKIDKTLPGFIMETHLYSHHSSAVYGNRYGQKLLFKVSQITIQNKSIKLVAVSDITKELDNREVDAWIKLARTLSHEIMNNIAPVTTLSKVISGYFLRNNKIIHAGEVDDSVIQNTIKGLNVIEERSVGLMNFVENYRKFTKLPEPRLKEVNLSVLLKNNLLAASAFPDFETVEIKKSIAEKLLFVADGKLLSQVITNLLKNAWEALFSGGVENPILVIKLWQTDRSARIEIANNGPDIPSEIREQIFVPFYTTKEEGSGIGLSLSKQIMLTMGGDILLNSERKGLTSFIIVLNKTV